MIFLALLLTFFALMLLVMRGATDQFDDMWLQWTQAHLLPHTAWLWQAVSWPGYAPQAYGVRAFFVLFASWYANRRGLVLMLVAVLASPPLTMLFMHLVSRPRPTPEQARVIGESSLAAAYPSGHIVTYTVLCGLLILLIHDALPAGRGERRRDGIVCGILAAVILLVGPARVALGHDRPTDAFGGYLLAGALLIVLARWRLVPSSPVGASEASECS